ncbi:MAG: GNAT family N-acetyltransferase [Longimicrobiales bacterium]
MTRLAIAALTPSHWESVRDIYLEGIATGNATFEATAPDWAEWDAGHTADCRLVALSDGAVVGWAALSPVSRRAVYRGVAEVSVYVREDTRGRGVGRRLLAALIEASEAAGYWTLQASVFLENMSTIRLHRSLGFREVGRRERVGVHHGGWRDTMLLERRSAVVGTQP